MKQSALGSVFIFRGRVIGLDNYKSKESLSRVVKLQLDIHIGANPFNLKEIKYIKEMICLIQCKLVHGLEKGKRLLVQISKEWQLEMHQ